MFHLSTLAISIAFFGCASSPGTPSKERTTTAARPDTNTDDPTPNSSEAPTSDAGPYKSDAGPYKSDAGPYKDVAAFCEYWTQKPNESETARPCSPTWKEDFEIAGVTGPYRSARALAISENNTALMVETSNGLFYLADLQLDASSYGEEVETTVQLRTFDAADKKFLQIDTKSKSRAKDAMTETIGVMYCNENGSCKTLVHEVDEQGDGYSTHETFVVTREGATVTVTPADGPVALFFAETVGTHDLLALP